MLFRPLPYPNADRLVSVLEQSAKGQTYGTIARATFDALLTHSKSFAAFGAAHTDFIDTLVGVDPPTRVYAYAVSPQFLRALGVEPVLGRPFTADDYHGGVERPALLMDQFWRARGGDRDVVGKTWQLEDRTLRVAGVMPASFIFPTDQGNPQPEVLVPYVDDPTAPAVYRARSVPPIGRLRAGVAIAQAQAEAQAIAQGAATQTSASGDVRTRVMSLQDAMFEYTQPVMLVLLGAAGFVVLIVCVNIASLVLARGSERKRELAVRTALGASRARLVRQLMIESLVLAMAGGIAGVLIAYWTFDIVYAQVPERVYRMFPAGIDLRVVMFAGSVSILAGLFFGALPAARLSKPDVNESLQGGKGGGIARLSWRTGRMMVIGEVALVVMLLAGAGLMVKSFARLRGLDLGLNPARVYTLYIDLPRSRYPRTAVQQFDQQLLERLSHIPGIVAVAGASDTPMLTAGWAPLTLPTQPKTPAGTVWLVTADYFSTFGIPLLAGRTFTEQESRSNAAVAVLSESAARAGWPNGDALGRMFQNGRDQPRQIIGIVADVRRTRKVSGQPVMYTPFDAANFRGMLIAMRIGGEPRAIEAMVMAQVHSLDSKVVARLVKYTDVLDRQIALPRFQMLLFSVFGALGLVLTAIGIFGVVGYVVSRRTHEIGVRMALGADAHNVQAMVIRQALTPVVIGLGLGLLGAFWATQLLTSWLFDGRPHDPLTLTTVSCLLLATALGATYLPARRASQVDPMEALRAE